MVEDVKGGLGDSENQSDLARRSDSLQSRTAIGKKASGEEERGRGGGRSEWWCCWRMQEADSLQKERKRETSAIE